MYAHTHAQTYIHTCTHTNTNIQTPVCVTWICDIEHLSKLKNNLVDFLLLPNLRQSVLLFFNSVGQLDGSPDMRYSSDSASYILLSMLIFHEVVRCVQNSYGSSGFVLRSDIIKNEKSNPAFNCAAFFVWLLCNSVLRFFSLLLGTDIHV